MTEVPLVIHRLLAIGLSLALVFGAAACAESAAAPGTIPSGRLGVPDVKVSVLTEGNGLRPQPGDIVGLHYVGTFRDGRQFDSSRDTGRVFRFTLGQGGVIAGWDLIVAQMKVGDRWRCEIPHQLAYGERGHPAGIPGRTDLIFDMELIDVRPGAR